MTKKFYGKQERHTGKDPGPYPQTDTAERIDDFGRRGEQCGHAGEPAPEGV